MKNLTLTMKSNKLFSVFAVIALVFGVFASVLTSPKAQAAELAHTVTKTTLTTNGTVAPGENIDLAFGWSVADGTTINNGDTITLTLPDTIAFPTTLSGQQLTAGGQAVGTYTVDASTGKITLTFDSAGAAYFAANPLGKGGELGVKVVTSRKTNANTDATTINVGKFSNIDLGSIQFEGAGNGAVDPYTFKYGYLDQRDPTLVRWKC